MQPAKPAHPAKFYDPAYPSVQTSYGMGAQGQPGAWSMPRNAPLQPEQGGCLRTSVLVTGILHIVLSVVGLWFMYWFKSRHYSREATG